MSTKYSHLHCFILYDILDSVNNEQVLSFVVVPNVPCKKIVFVMQNNIMPIILSARSVILFSHLHFMLTTQSPVLNQPSSKASAVAFSLFR